MFLSGGVCRGNTVHGLIIHFFLDLRYLNQQCCYWLRWWANTNESNCRQSEQVNTHDPSPGVWWDESRLNTLRHAADTQTDGQTDRQVDRQVVNHNMDSPRTPETRTGRWTHRTGDLTATYPNMLEIESSRPPGGGCEIFLLQNIKTIRQNPETSSHIQHPMKTAAPQARHLKSDFAVSSLWSLDEWMLYSLINTGFTRLTQ